MFQLVMERKFVPLCRLSAALMIWSSLPASVGDTPLCADLRIRSAVLGRFSHLRDSVLELFSSKTVYTVE
jgi:hypothetical protein